MYAYPASWVHCRGEKPQRCLVKTLFKGAFYVICVLAFLFALAGIKNFFGWNSPPEEMKRKGASELEVEASAQIQWAY